jgi:hypothetical protein
MVPLLEQMGHKAMETRHWKGIQQMTKHEFDCEEGNFTLGDVIESSPLEFKEKIEVRTAWLFQLYIEILRPVISACMHQGDDKELFVNRFK